MNFASIEFIFIFLPIVLLLIEIFNDKKKYILIISSIIFMFLAEGFFILMVSVIALFNFLIAKNLSIKKRGYLLFFGISINLFILFIYKYLIFFNNIFNFYNGSIKILLPIGISFITFHSISYLVDVYKKKIPYEKDFANFYLFIFMFPQVIAGPITRYSNIYLKLKTLTSRFYNIGVYYFIIGLTQKILIADQLGKYVNEVYSLPVKLISSIDSFLAPIIYLFQLYFDFSGYSHMALGLGFFIGVKLPKNFNFPLMSYSVGEFWKRWHISLSSFIKDYLFIPINTILNIKKNDNSLFYFLSILICFLLSGLWHGANLTFVIWGMLNAFFVILEKIFNINKKNFVTKLYFCISIVVCFIYFRSSSISFANDLIINLFINNFNNVVIEQFINIRFLLTLLIAYIFSIKNNCLFFRGIYRRNSHKLYFNIIGLFLIYILLSELILNTFNPFIYFKF